MADMKQCCVRRVILIEMQATKTNKKQQKPTKTNKKQRKPTTKTNINKGIKVI
ncbi:MAG: hypothetical protein IJP13_02660 [Lachnospiraceae bacterium]|nr:hypothetical protein [Lachnospiraceae bacterium]